MEAAIEHSILRLREAREKALRLSIDEEKFRDFDPLWMELFMDEWKRMPEKIRDCSKYGHLHIHIYWEQYFTMSVYPKKMFPDLSMLLRYFRYAENKPELENTSRILDRMYPDRLSLEENELSLRQQWNEFIQDKKGVESGGAVYTDIADLLQGQSPFIWSGHWVFDGVVLDRYHDGEIDFNSYYASHFHSKENSERFEQFEKFMKSIGMNREKTWTLFSPSGERIWKAVAVLCHDGNTHWILLEGENEFLDICSSGS